MAAHTSAGKTVVAEYAFALATRVWLASLFLFLYVIFVHLKQWSFTLLLTLVFDPLGGRPLA